MITIDLAQQIYNLKQLHTVPVYPNKKIPKAEHGYKSGVINADIASWLARGDNVAISLSLSRLACIDVDMHGESDGLAEFKKLCKALGEIDTCTEQTATGNGLHFIVQDEGITAGNCEITPGVEFKINSIIVCSPSQINGIQYKVIGGINPDGTYKFAKLSPAWLELINNSSKSKSKKVYKSGNNKKYDAKDFGNQDYNRVFQTCKWLQYVKQHSYDLLEPLWFVTVNMLAYDINADAFIHWLSEGYATYSYAETQKKIDYSRSKGYFCGCKHIARNYYEICKGCPKAEEIIGGKNVR